MAAAVHRLAGTTQGAVPVVDFARGLDIVQVDLTEIDGFEGMLLTDAVRSRGGILANTSHGPRRARFTVAHELGHFLLERHVPTSPGGFACRPSDMREGRIKTRDQRQETEANRFAISLLAPPRLTRPWVEADPDLISAREMADTLEISRQAALIRYVELHDEPLAAIFSRNGNVTGISRGRRFPWIKLNPGDPLGGLTAAGRIFASGRTGRTGMREATPAAWLSDPDIELFEQASISANGHATTLLWATISEDEEDEDGVRKPLTEPRFR